MMRTWCWLRARRRASNDVGRVFAALVRSQGAARPDALGVIQAAHRGYAFAMAHFPSLFDDSERFRFLKAAAALGERDAFIALSFRLFDCIGSGRERDSEASLHFAMRAAELGSVDAILHVAGLSIGLSRWKWLAKAAWAESSEFLLCFPLEVCRLNDGDASAAPIVFEIGRALQGHVNEQAKTIFNENYLFDLSIGPAKEAIAFYEAQIQAAKDAMRAWTQVGLKLKVVKDVRIIIAKMIWESREEAKYKLK
jgi:TPR repeat protein